MREYSDNVINTQKKNANISNVRKVVIHYINLLLYILSFDRIQN